jgi:hypothetical protein
MDTISDILMTLALGGLAVSLALFASALLCPYLRSAWRQATALARAVFCGAVVVACLFGGAKHTGKITYPKTDADVAYLTDAGSYVTNDAVHVAFTRVPTVPDTATFYLDYCALDGTNAQGVATNWVNAKTATFADLSVPFDFAFANATNFNWVAYTDWTPGHAVQTNGVWHAYWGVDKKTGSYFIPVRTCVRADGKVIATPKSKWDAKDPMELTEAEAYERYAPDAAILIDTSLIGTNEFVICPAQLGHGTNYCDVDWGDGTVEKNVYAWFWGTEHSHTYAKAGRYVIRVGGTVTNPFYNFKNSQKPGVLRLLRHPDSGNCITIGSCKNMTAFPDGKLARWPAATTSIGSVYYDCTALAATELPAWPSGLTQANNTYYSCSKLTGDIPAWPSSLTQARYTYYSCKNLTGAWTSDPAELMPTNITSHGGCVSGASAALRALFYSDWGGTRTKTE